MSSTKKGPAGEMSNKIFDFTRGFIDAHLIIPTYVRRRIKSSEEYSPYNLGGHLPALGHAIVGAYPGISYYFLFKHHPKIASIVLTTQIATNLVSGIYEWYRYEKNKLNETEQPTTESTSEEESLEKITDNPEIQIPNPWDIDVPKIRGNE
jgi:hypothetical protein